MTEKFVKVAKVTELSPGGMTRVEIEGHPLLLATVGGSFYATDDTCTHEDASLSSGFLEAGLVKCPLHNSRFNIRTGAVLEEPADEDLQTYAVKLDGEDIFIAFPDSR